MLGHFFFCLGPQLNILVARVRAMPRLPPFKVIVMDPPYRSSCGRYHIRDWWNVPCRNGLLCQDINSGGKGQKCRFQHLFCDTEKQVFAGSHQECLVWIENQKAIEDGLESFASVAFARGGALA